jgi:hypothetical protein
MWQRQQHEVAVQQRQHRATAAAPTLLLRCCHLHCLLRCPLPPCYCPAATLLRCCHLRCLLQGSGAQWQGG